MIRVYRGITFALAAAGLFAAGASAQQSQTIAVETHFMGYSFDEALGPEVANLFLMPVAYRMQWSDELTFDLYTAWGRGQVEQNDVVYSLSGLVDSRIKATWRAREWASVSMSLSLPTGKASQDASESLVASVLSSDLLGFRESSWGTGFGMTTGVATATRIGEWGLGVGASFRMAGEFEPVADSSLGYQPGNEIRVRAGLDRNVGESGKFTTAATWQNFSDDQLDGRNLFQAGSRLSLDAAYAFRAGSSTWTVYAADVWRENGDLFLDLIDAQGTIVGDTTLATATQNLIIGAVSGSVPIGSQYQLRPSIDYKLQTREESDGSQTGSGWMAGFGADFPLRLFGAYDFFPMVKYVTGSIEDATGVMRSVSGFSGTLTMRWSF